MKKKILSLCMACCILFSSIIFSPPSSAAGDSLTITDHGGMYGAHLLSRTEITANDDGSFDVDIDMYTYYSVLKENRSVTGSTDDYYEVDRNGYYLVELWGGDGAGIGDAKGGLGGYTSEVIYLEVGDIIFYTLGGVGTASAEAGKGGGANGGGGAGNKGSVAVGGGGGYSAAFLYKFGAETERFYNTYTDEDKNLINPISEADRVSKYVMIAGGGGGAGSSSIGSNEKSLANGGDGGYADTVSGTLEGEGYAVSGIFYSGVGGNSTDGTGEYAGKGGSYLPGKVVSTSDGFGKGSQPNDWVGAQNTSAVGGAGGNGNYRGGGGGAGFAGGSGGVASNFAISRGIGGGGGGSSFISSLFLESTPELEAARASAEGYRIGRERTEKRNADADGELGGYFHIVYLDEEDVNYLSDLQIELVRTPFFSVTDFTVENTVGGVVYNDFTFKENSTQTETTANENKREIRMNTVPYDLATNACGDGVQSDLSTLQFIISGVSLMPNVTTGTDRDHLKIHITFTPKADFAGGNNVPLFAGKDCKIKVYPTDQNEHSQHVTGSISMKNYCGYVNVPLSLSPSPVNHTPQGLDPANTVHKVSSLFVDRYANIRGNYQQYWQYYFLEDISAHTVTDENGNLLPIYNKDGTEATVSPDETQRYLISLSATPKTPTGKVYAKLGDPVTKQTFTGWSIVTIAGSGIEALGDNMIVYNKSLSYDYETGEYILGLHISSDSSGSIQSADAIPEFDSIGHNATAEDGSQLSNISTITIPYTGEYTVTLKGGNGGQGGGSGMTIFNSTGGKGGTGAYITATFRFERGVQLQIFSGANASDQTLVTQGGEGGSPSYLAVLDENGNISTYLMIAAGGPGGGGATPGILSGDDASQPTSISNSMDAAGILAYTGKSGGAGALFNPGDAGKAGTSYVYTGGTENDLIQHISNRNLGDPGSNAPAGGSGSFVLDAIGDSELSGNKAQLGQYILNAAISKYFTVTGISVDEVTAGEVTQETLSALQALQGVRYADKDTPLASNNEDYTYEMWSIPVSITPEAMTENTDVDIVEFTLNIHLTPREGFLGGNDVKIIEPARDTTGLLTGMKLSLSNDQNKFINVDESRSLDYANVPLHKELNNTVVLTTQNKTYVYGDTLYMKDLVESVSFPNLSSYGWKADYLKCIDPSTDQTLLTPSETTTYTLTASIVPTVEAPFSEVRPVVDIVPITEDAQATVYTDFKVSFDLKHVELEGVTPNAQGKYLVPFVSDGNGGYVAAQDYTFSLTASAPESGHNHHLPKSISVKVGERELVADTDYVYDRGYDTGSASENLSRSASVTIFAQSINGNVTVTVAACEEHHNLYYIYQNAPESDVTTTVTLTEKHYSEHVLPEEDFQTVNAPLPQEYEHYTFEWDYGALTADAEGHYIMPKGEAWVTGRYIPKNYTLTIHYVDGSGNNVTDSYIQDHAYGSSYSIASPVLSGLVANTATVSGHVTGNVEYTVVYTSAKGILTVYYLYEDGTQAADPYTKELTSGDEFSVDSPIIEGYTADKLTVSGTMDDDGETFTVIYTPNSYTLTFTVDGETLETRTVEYGKPYSYDAASGTYKPFPDAVKLGYTFEGWKRGDIPVSAADTVNVTSDIILNASFKSLIFTVTVNYINDLGETVHPSVSQDFAVGDTYEFASPTVVGHTAEQSKVSGTVAAQNLSITVLYTRLQYTVTVNYEMPNGAPNLASHVETVRHGDSYSIKSPDETDNPALAAYKPNIAIVEGVVNAANVTVTVTYYSTAISVDIAWGDMTFSYDPGIWNPNTHAYSGGSFDPVNDSNTVTVTNNTVEKSITVEFGFIPTNVYPGITGYYSDEKGKTVAQTDLKSNNSITATFHLENADVLGALSLPDTFVAGTCTLTIREK